MAMVNISMQGSPEELISEVADIMLQHPTYRKVFLTAAERVQDIISLKDKMQAENMADYMKSLIVNGGHSI